MKYRKKPVVVEAFQMTPERRVDNSEWPAWLHEAWNKDPSVEGSVCSLFFPTGNGIDNKLVIRTLEGALTVDWGYWIIRGVKGELYPCRPDIFEATYKEVKE